MAVAVESFSEASATSITTDVVLGKPTGTADGDDLVAVIGASATAFFQSVTLPSDWVEVEATDDEGFNTVGIGVYHKKAGASEPSNYTFQSTSSSSRFVAAMFRISGADAANPVDASHARTLEITTAGAPVAPSISPSAAGCLLLCFACSDDGDKTFTEPSGMDLEWQKNLANSSTNRASGAAASETLASAGATGTRTFGISANDLWATVSIAIAPAAGGGGEDTLTADDIESASEVSSPAIGQVHALNATDVQSASEVSAPAIGQTHALTADDVEAASEVTSPAVGQVHALTADDVESASEVSSPALAIEGEEPEPEPEPEEEPRREVSWPWRPNRYAVEREEEASRYQEARKAEEAAERALEARRKALARAEKAATRIERGLLASEPSVSPPPDRLAALAKARERVKAAEQALRLAEQSMTEARIRAEDEEIALLLLLAA